MNYSVQPQFKYYFNYGLSSFNAFLKMTGASDFWEVRHARENKASHWFRYTTFTEININCTVKEITLLLFSTTKQKNQTSDISAKQLSADYLTTVKVYCRCLWISAVLKTLWPLSRCDILGTEVTNNKAAHRLYHCCLTLILCVTRWGANSTTAALKQNIKCPQWRSQEEQ